MLVSRQWRRGLRVSGRYRSHYIEEIREAVPGTKVRVCGRITRVRPLGHINFVLIAEHTDTVQAVWRRDSPIASHTMQALRSLRHESFCSVTGTVSDGREIAVEDLDVLSTPDPGIARWPIQSNTGEDVRLKFRYLDLRRSDLQSRIKLRSRVMHTVRCWLQSARFTEIETPILTAPSPEGAREFLVRSGGQEFALAQSPQLYKQLVMAGGFDRYFQFARCFRDEDGRSDRQIEFTQLDMEMAYVSADDVMVTTEAMMRDLSETIPDLQMQFPTTTLPRYSYNDVVRRFGCDKPDLRSGQMVLHDVAEGWSAILCKKAGASPLDAGLDRVVVVPVLEGGVSDASAVPGEIADLCAVKLGAEPGDCMVVSRDRSRLGLARNRLIPWLHQRRLLDLDRHVSWIWVTEFPLFQPAGAGRDAATHPSPLQPTHHPFTAPADPARLRGAPRHPDALLALTAQSYDLVVNGVEVGGGSVRIHDHDLQKLVLSVLGQDDSAAFAALLSALRHGCPPHGGIAFGFDRFLSQFPSSTSSLRDVIAFPKSGLGKDLMMGAPRVIATESEARASPMHVSAPGSLV